MNAKSIRLVARNSGHPRYEQGKGVKSFVESFASRCKAASMACLLKHQSPHALDKSARNLK